MDGRARTQNRTPAPGAEPTLAPSPQRPLHVLQLGAVPPPFGGVQVNLMAIRAFLRQRGDRCSAINLTGNRQPDHDDLYFPQSAWDVLRLIARLKSDVLHLHIGGHLPWRLLALGAICAAWPRTAAVLTLHSGGYPTSAEGRQLTPASAKARVLQRFDRLIAVNQEIAAFFSRCGVARDRIRVVSPYADERPSEGPLPEPIERFLAAHAPVLMTIGLLEPEYDLGLQIDVVGALAATHPGIGLVIVGSGSLDAALRERLARTAWRDHVLLYGDLEHQMTLAALRRADVFLRTTTYDGDALSVREALALDIPVVATRTALRPPGVRLVDVGDARAVEAEIRACLSEPREPRVAEVGATRGATPDNIAAVVRLYDEALGPPSMRSIREASAA